MWFNSWEFLYFLPTVLAIYYNLNRRAQNLWLVVASYFFYGWWDWRFLSLVLASTLVDYFAGLYIQNQQDTGKRKRGLYASLLMNLGALSLFKYFNFFVDSFTALGDSIGLNFNTPVMRLLPPVGISFYTFQTLSYTIDIYRRKQKPVRNFIDFALYVTYFPQLVAGPIERASTLLPQIQKKRIVTLEQFQAGCLLILIGLFKKIALADAAAPLVDEVFANPQAQSSIILLKGLYLFSLQIYCDFSGYSSIARGVSKLIGIELSENFQTPYLAANITDFWRRWHITLSRWLRDYLYIPLGGNRIGKTRTYINLMLTMLIGGL
ncbi:MAG: MBOAT family protein, partial [Calditrichaeota bacterium]